MYVSDYSTVGVAVDEINDEDENEIFMLRRKRRRTATTMANEQFDEAVAFGNLEPDNDLNMLRVLRYNTQDRGVLSGASSVVLRHGRVIRETFHGVRRRGFSREKQYTFAERLCGTLCVNRVQCCTIDAT